jgi:hypothetical protein
MQKSWIRWAGALSVTVLAFVTVFQIFPPFEMVGQPAWPFVLKSPLLEQLELFLFVLKNTVIGWTLGLFLLFPIWWVGATASKCIWRWPLLILLSMWILTLWICRVALNSPTLFLDSLFFSKGTLFGLIFTKLFAAVSIFTGPDTVSIILIFSLVFAIFLARRSMWKMFIIGLHTSLVGWIVWPQASVPKMDLPAQSVVMFLADSLRADRFTPETMPNLVEQVRVHSGSVSLNVIPASTRTSVSLTSFFTGGSPEAHGVLNMFSAPKSLKIPTTLAATLAERGYCTVAIAEYPGDFLRRQDYGFEVVVVPDSLWLSQLKQALLKRDAFTLSVLANDRLQRFLPKALVQIFRGLMINSNPKALLNQLKMAIDDQCQRRPIFAFVFTQITHMPYIQRWPYYLDHSCLAKDGARYGHYSWADAPHRESADVVQCLYDNGVRAFDEAANELISSVFSNGRNATSTVIISSDHGEYLFDGVPYSGHGDFLGPEQGLRVPWIVIGKLQERFRFGEAMISNQWLKDRILDASVEKIPTGIVGSETEIWFDEKVAPVDRIHYPTGPQLLTVGGGNPYLMIRPEFVDVVEGAKFHVWFYNGHRYDLRPGAMEDKIFRDGHEVVIRDLPGDIQKLVIHYVEKASRARSYGH